MAMLTIEQLQAIMPALPPAKRAALFSFLTAAIDEFAIHRALEIVWALIADANRYFAGEEPWAHKKTNPARMETILYVTAEVLRQIAIVVQPVMPEGAAKLLDQLAVPENARSFATLGAKGRLEPGTQLLPPQPVFPRHIEAETESAVN